MSYVIMLAAANSLSNGGAGLVYIVNVLPAILVKLSAPYWFDRATYQSRVSMAAFCMALAFFVTGYSVRALQQPHHSILLSFLPFLGVSLVSLQCGLGEASLLAAAGKCDLSNNQESSKGHCLTAWSSGTGLAGVTGYLWTVAGTQWLDWGVATTIQAALVLALFYVLIYRTVLGDMDEPTTQTQYVESSQALLETAQAYDDTTEANGARLEMEIIRAPQADEYSYHGNTEGISEQVQPNIESSTNDFESTHQLSFILSLWPYTVPLFLVYAAEYACQAGAWTAMGFPMEDPIKRNQFYQTSNWLYQAGVFVSRSSGSFLNLAPITLWIMPLLQVLNLIVFSLIAVQSPQTSWLYNPPLLYVASFWTGLLGGAVYVHGYKRIVVDFQGSPLTEVALATTSVAEGIGILTADVLGLFLQGCLYRVHHLEGALVHCPLKGVRLRV